MSLAAGTMIKKFHVALFLNTGTPLSPIWKQIKKSTDNIIAMNPENKVYDYIADEAPTTEVDRYSPSLSQPITMYKGEPEYEYIFSKFFEQAVGADAHSEILIVFYGHDVAAAYKAWKAACVLQIDNMNPVESTITVQINFNGTTEQGTAVVTAGVPVFTATSGAVEFQQTFTVQTGGSDQAGAKIVCGGVEKLTDANGEAVFTLIEGQTYAVGATYLTTEAADVFVANHLTPTLTLALA